MFSQAPGLVLLAESHVNKLLYFCTFVDQVTRTNAIPSLLANHVPTYTPRDAPVSIQQATTSKRTDLRAPATMSSLVSNSVHDDGYA